MIDPMAAIRAVHYASTLLAAGALGFDALLRADTVRYRRTVAAGAAVALLSALLWLWEETARMAGGAPTAALALRVLGATEFGHIWAVRLVLLALWLPAILWTRGRAALIAAALMGIAASASLAFSGHAAAEGALGLGADMVHLTAAALWPGALLPFAALLRLAVREGTNAAFDEAARTAGRFSPLGLVCVGCLLLTGIFRAWGLVGSIPGLVGTPYGQLLLAKISLFLAMVALAAINRQRLTPALSTPGARGAAQRLRRSALIEAGLGLVILCDVGVLGISVPAAHDQPIWPFPVTWAWTAVASKTGGEAMLVGATLLAVSGLAALALAVTRRQWRWFAIGLLPCALALLVANNALWVDAVPTMYQSSPLPFDVATIAAGAPIYRDNCVPCHGRYGYGDGPMAAQLAVKPADLARVHVAHHSDGSLFWWVRYGKGEGAMPAFANLLDQDQAWDLVDYLRALSDAVAAKTLGAAVDPERRVPAPGFAFEHGQGDETSLADLAGKQDVLLVLYALPDSEARLKVLAQAAPALESTGLTVVAMPLGEAQESGAIFAPADPDLVETYALFRRLGDGDTLPKAEHSEFLIDRWGYLRARFLDGATATPDQLRAMVAAMAKESTPPPASAAAHHH